MILKEFKLWQWGECYNGCDLQILIQQKKTTRSNKRNLNTTKEIKITDVHSNEVKISFNFRVNAKLLICKILY